MGKTCNITALELLYIYGCIYVYVFVHSVYICTFVHIGILDWFYFLISIGMFIWLFQSMSEQPGINNSTVMNKEFLYFISVWSLPNHSLLDCFSTGQLCQFHRFSTGPGHPINTGCLWFTVSALDSSPPALFVVHCFSTAQLPTRPVCGSLFQHWTAPHPPYVCGLLFQNWTTPHQRRSLTLCTSGV